MTIRKITVECDTSARDGSMPMPGLSKALPKTFDACKARLKLDLYYNHLAKLKVLDFQSISRQGIAWNTKAYLRILLYSPPVP
uniref:Uncharacterized protein n=1 Tax=Candidatus Kentrum sp. FW TaxID=2126338 RepID=A0A450TMC8_9GAMM|nr:MAG: hypothetical protein BECKFW1821C_GA0114237_101627 [Candidatus Kentron sp. FW]